MPWLKFNIEHFGFGHEVGPPPSFKIAWLRVSWWAGEMQALVEKMGRALKEAREDLRR